jgi:putative nucleotidyltransferase with HDIG domain
MKMISIDSIEGGEVLAESVMNEERNILIPAGTVLKEDYAPLIKSIGIMNLKVVDPYERYQMPNPIIHPSRFSVLTDWVKKRMEMHIYRDGSSLKEFEIIANEIVNEINAVSEDSVIDMTQRSANLYEHTVMVTLLSVMVAKKLHLGRERQFDIAVGSLLHDIGLRYITTPFENVDMEQADQKNVFEYKKHTILGYSAVEEESWVSPVARKMILTHHEKSDGSGFPMHQRVKETECRILQACDAFDCMISGMGCNRTSVREAVEVISQGAGTAYDPAVVDALLSLVAKYPVGTTVQLNEEEEGLVISQTNNSEKPIVMVLDTAQEHRGRKYNLLLDHQISIL